MVISFSALNPIFEENKAVLGVQGGWEGLLKYPIGAGEVQALIPVSMQIGDEGKKVIPEAIQEIVFFIRKLAICFFGAAICDHRVQCNPGLRMIRMRVQFDDRHDQCHDQAKYC